MIDTKALALMKSTAILINTSRGEVVDASALADALRHKRLAAAALDVFATEPLTAAAAEPFAGLDNLLLTPHIAGLTVEANIRVNAITVANVLKELRS
jgi:(S)-sulfolactate dehydrogenase